MNKKSRILRVTTVDLALEKLIKGQLGYVNRFYDVIAVSSVGPHLDSIKNREGIQHFSIEMTRNITPIKDLKSLYKLCKLIIELKPDCIHSHTPKAGLLAMLAGYILRIPHRLHTVSGITWLDKPNSLKRHLLKKVEKITYNLSTAVFPNSFSLMRRMEEEGLTKGCKEVKVLGPGSSNGIDTYYFNNSTSINKEAARVCSENMFNQDDFIVCFVGRIVKDKGVQELIDAIDQSPNNVKLIIVGPYEANDSISNHHKKRIEDSDRIIHVGYQNDVRPYITASQALILPSYREGFPNVVLQALALERPTIVSDINGCNEIVSDYENGLILPKIEPVYIKNSIEKLSNDKEFYNELKQRTRGSILKYDQEHVWKAILNRYQKDMPIPELTEETV